MDYSTEEDFSTFTTKRRRTKRHRSLLSASASSTYCGASDGAIVTAAASDPPNKATAASSTSYTSSSSASPSDHLNDVMSEVVTTEEIDMANFLILLSQGLHKNTNNSNTNNNTNNIVLYECKTCNRTFSSFQALGGHRTSHKKIKPPLSPSIIPSTDHPNSDNNIDTKIKIVDNKVRDRVHECSICGSEFPSGQALGGHMRRHRAAAAPPPSSSEITPDGSTEVIDTGGGGPRNILSLDLNLPAPDDQDPQQDDHMESTFVHVLPRPAPLVDCHN